MRTPLTRVAATAIVALMTAWLVLPISAASAATATNVPDSEEAWFLASKEPLAELPEGDPTCELPTGCNASGNVTRPNPHPEGVLVVAANAGEPDAQTYINFDTSKLPLGAAVTGGVVTLPVTRDPDARNVRPETAKMVACRVTGFIPDGTDAGSYKDRPTYDDKTCVDVKQAKADPLTYTVNLERFGKTWAGDPFSMMGITLLVDPKIEPPAPDETWRVTFNTKRRSEQKTKEEAAQPEASRVGYPPITSTLEYRVTKTALPPLPPGGDTGGGPTGNPFPTSDPGSTDTGGSTDFGTGSTDVASTDTGTSGDFGTSGVPAADSGAIEPPAAADTGVAPPAAAPGADQPLAQGTQPVAATGASPAVWVLPIVAVLMAAAMAWSLMQPVELAGDREGAVSRLMRTRRLSSQNNPTPS